MDHELHLWVQGLRAGWPMRFRPLGGSMTPVIRHCDEVLIIPGQRCRLGDIVLCQPGEDDLVLHRVIAKQGENIITKGDFNQCPDPPVTGRDILGRAVARVRGGKQDSLESRWSRFLGLGFSFAIARLPSLRRALVAGKRWWTEKLALFLQVKM